MGVSLMDVFVAIVLVGIGNIITFGVLAWIIIKGLNKQEVSNV